MVLTMPLPGVPVQPMQYTPGPDLLPADAYLYQENRERRAGFSKSEAAKDWEGAKKQTRPARHRGKHREQAAQEGQAEI